MVLFLNKECYIKEDISIAPSSDHCQLDLYFMLLKLQRHYIFVKYWCLIDTSSIAYCFSRRRPPLGSGKVDLPKVNNTWSGIRWDLHSLLSTIPYEPIKCKRLISILFLIYNKTGCEYFGEEKQSILHLFNEWLCRFINCYILSLLGKFVLILWFVIHIFLLTVKRFLDKHSS